MITSTVKVHDRLGEIDEWMDTKIVGALNDAAEGAAEIANVQSGNTNHWRAMAARGTFNGFVSGIRADTPLWHVVDKGSLGKRTARLKNDRRKPDWQVNRGANPYTAHRRSTTTGGVAPRNVINPARTGGRKILTSALQR